MVLMPGKFLSNGWITVLLLFSESLSMTLKSSLLLPWLLHWPLTWLLLTWLLLTWLLLWILPWLLPRLSLTSLASTWPIVIPESSKDWNQWEAPHSSKAFLGGIQYQIDQAHSWSHVTCPVLIVSHHPCPETETEVECLYMRCHDEPDSESQDNT